MRVFMNDDRHAMAKHSVIYPTQEELEGVQNMVSHTERALKAVSDWLDKQEKGTSKSDSEGNDAEKERCVRGTARRYSRSPTRPLHRCFLDAFCSEHKDPATRSLRGVMRVGLVAKGLLLKGDLDLELVLLCKEKPTSSLLKKVSDNLVLQLKVRTRRAQAARRTAPSRVTGDLHRRSGCTVPWVPSSLNTGETPKNKK